MTDIRSGFDPALFGVWPAQPVYRASIDARVLDEKLQRRVRRVWLEIKAASGAHAEELRRLLNDMTVEMRSQFDYFRGLRAAADAVPEGADDAAQKLARADVKAATDAMSLIVRTLEKVDALQRQLARDREEEAERTADVSGRAEARAHFLRLIEARAEERAQVLFAQWTRQQPTEASDATAGMPEPPG
jgi:hypothetical protein